MLPKVQPEDTTLAPPDLKETPTPYITHDGNPAIDNNDPSNFYLNIL